MGGKRVSSEGTVRFSLLENGLDFVLSALEHVAGAPSNRDLKYAVLHLSSGIELILKEKLIREHWTLVFDRIENASLSKFRNGDFNSVTFENCIQRLTGICGVELDGNVRSNLKNFRDRRNRMEHFQFDESVEAIKSSCSMVLNFLYDFIHQELPPTADIEDEVNQILSYLREFDEFVKERMKFVQKMTRGCYSPVMICPRCLQQAVTIDGGEVQCHFCHYSAQAENAADEYVSEVMGLSSYETVKDGGEWPVYSCPECGNTALVHEDGDFTCFSCGEHWTELTMRFCESCGKPFAVKCSQAEDGHYEIDSFMCPGCWEYRMSD